MINEYDFLMFKSINRTVKVKIKHETPLEDLETFDFYFYFKFLKAEY